MSVPAPDPTARFIRDFEALAGAPAPRLGLAVSGGPDSLALLLLAHSAYPGRVEAATVDHNLRPEGRAEAALVASRCATLGVPHETLSVEVVTAGEGLQSAARSARYAELEDWAARRSLPALLTAHHLEDRAETLLMRLTRGSGVAGLAGIRPKLPLGRGDVTLYRPLLAWRRVELAEIVALADIQAANDPSNADDRFSRTRIRRHLAENTWLDPAALARSAAALAEAEDALAQVADALFAARVREDGGVLILDPADLPPELLRRLVVRCLRALSPEAGPRGDQVGALLGSLARAETATLAGVKSKGGGVYRFELAAPRKSVRLNADGH